VAGVNSYEDLEVWQRSVALATRLYKVTEPFPSEEKFGLISQIRRSATSIPANIAEGWGRGSTKEYIQFLITARGSLMELETHLIIANELGYLVAERLSVLRSETGQLGRMLNGLINALRARRGVSH
jgi:four helix bundle protein